MCVWIYSARDMKGALCRFLKPFSHVASCLILSFANSSCLHSPELISAISFRKTLCLASHYVYQGLESAFWLEARAVVGFTLFPAVQCPKTLVLYVLPCFLVDYGGR